MDLIISNPDMVMAHHIHHSTLPVGVKVTSAFLLVGFLSNALIKRKGEKIELLKVEESMRTVILPIKGMTCSHCAANVQKALSECPGVVSARVDLNAGKAYISGTDFQLESLRKAVEAIGYSAGAPEERG
jgi:copper chaperone CopZ